MISSIGHSYEIFSPIHWTLFPHQWSFSESETCDESKEITFTAVYDWWTPKKKSTIYALPTVNVLCACLNAGCLVKWTISRSVMYAVQSRRRWLPWRDGGWKMWTKFLRFVLRFACVGRKFHANYPSNEGISMTSERGFYPRYLRAPIRHVLESTSKGKGSNLEVITNGVQKCEL